MAEDRAAACRRNSWIVAIGSGVLVALMLLLVAQYVFLKAVLIGAVLALVLGAFLSWAFCSGRSAPAEPVLPVAEPKPILKSRPFEDETPAATPDLADGPAAPAVPDAPQKPAFLAGLSAAPLASTAEVEAEAARAAQAETAERPKPSATASSSTAFALGAALAKSKDEPVAPAPEMLSEPRNGTPDDLKQIKGIGPKLEALLNEVGVWHFDQIASWKARDIAFVDEKLVGFHGRITRDEWVKQARVLAKGGETEFSAKVKKGGVY